MLAMLALVFVIGVERYGAKNWIQIGGFAMQPSEFVKIIFVFFVAALLARSVQFVDVVKVSVAAAAHVLILVVQKDLGDLFYHLCDRIVCGKSKFVVFDLSIGSGNFGSSRGVETLFTCSGSCACMAGSMEYD